MCKKDNAPALKFVCTDCYDVLQVFTDGIIEHLMPPDFIAEVLGWVYIRPFEKVFCRECAVKRGYVNA